MFAKIDLRQPWLRQSLGLTQLQARQLAQCDHVINRLKDKLKDRRSKRSRMFRKITDGGDLKETIIVNMDGVEITFANTLSQLWIEGSKESLQWFITELCRDVKNMLIKIEDGSDPRLTNMEDHCGTVLEEQDTDQDPEVQHYEDLATKVKAKKDLHTMSLQSASFFFRLAWHMVHSDLISMSRYYI